MTAAVRVCGVLPLSHVSSLLPLHFPSLVKNIRVKHVRRTRRQEPKGLTECSVCLQGSAPQWDDTAGHPNTRFTHTINPCENQMFCEE